MRKQNFIECIYTIDNIKEIINNEHKKESIYLQSITKMISLCEETAKVFTLSNCTNE